MDRPRILTIILNYRTADLTLKAADAAVREMRSWQQFEIGCVRHLDSEILEHSEGATAVIAEFHPVSKHVEHVFERVL